MKTRNIIIAIIVVIIIVAIIYWYKKPKISLMQPSILLTPDWANKKVAYKFNAEGCSFEGVQDFQISTPAEKICPNGYQFKIYGQDPQRDMAFEAIIWKGESDTPVVPVQRGILSTQKIITDNKY